MDFRFCQQCAYKRQLLVPGQSSQIDPVQLHEIDDRLRQLKLYTQTTSYSKQKDALQKELKKFLDDFAGVTSSG